METNQNPNTNQDPRPIEQQILDRYYGESKDFNPDGWRERPCAPKFVITGDQDEDDERAFMLVDALLNAWQKKDPKNRYALVVTQQKEGYHYERFFEGETLQDEFGYTCMLSVPFYCDKSLAGNLICMGTSAKELSDIIAEGLEEVEKSKTATAKPKKQGGKSKRNHKK